MRAPAVLLAAALAAGAVAPAADAAPKKKKAAPPVCHLVKDPTGDVSNKVGPADAFPADQGLDVVGADVASDAKRITAVVRLAADPGEATAYAKRYIVQMNVAGLQNPLILAGAVTPTGQSYSMGYYGVGSTGTTGYNYPGTAIGKMGGKTVTVSALLSDIAGIEKLGTIKPNAKISAITVTANRRLPSLTQVTGQNMTADEALGKGSYNAGSRSCIAQYTG